MASTNDPEGHADKWEREKAKLEDHRPVEDREPLQEWANAKLETKEVTTAYWQLNKVRRLSASDAAQEPLTTFESAGKVSELIGEFAGDYVEGTRRQYRQAARHFFRFLGWDWAEDIHVGKSPAADNEVGRDDVLTRRECDALLAAVEHPRDRALITTLLATGQRITALLTLRRGDVSFEGAAGENGTIYLNDDALGLKDASGPRPLLWATDDVRKWLRQHPRTDDDAPLFCTVKSGHGGNHADGSYYEYEKGEYLSRQQVRRRLRNIAERTADLDNHVTVDPDKAGRPHFYRHSAITRMVREGVDEQQIKWLVGWDEDSGQLSRYSHVTDEEFMAAIRQSHGKDSDTETEVIGRPTIEECPECGADARVGTGTCEECGAIFSQQAAAAEDDEGTVFECVDCGRSISQSDAFCRYCGADQSDTDEDTDPMQEMVREAVREEVADLLTPDDDDIPDDTAEYAAEVRAKLTGDE